MNSYTGYPYPYQRDQRERRSGVGVFVAVAITVILAVAVFAGVYIVSQDSAQPQSQQMAVTDQETIVPNISANMIYAIDPTIIQEYRTAHDIDNKQALYRYSPENPFTDPLHVNTDITAELMGRVTSLIIDMKQNNDLSALAYCGNLAVLRIFHSEFLTDADIAYINMATALSQVEFVFDRNDITNTQKFADLTQCVCSNKKIVLLNADFENENTAYAIYHLFGKYYPSVVCSGLDYDFYRQLDEKIQALIDQVDFTNCENEKDRLLKCLVVVMKHLYYDDEVSDYSQTNDDIYEGTYMYDIVLNYNEHQLSSNLLIDGDRGYGCCTNFTSLLLAVCVKLDIEAYMVDGKRSNDVEFLHDWVYTPADGVYYCVDMTETNRWFKRSAGMYHSYNPVFIEGTKDIKDDPDFYASFTKQIFETYNDTIFTNYVFFIDPHELIRVIDTTRTTELYNAAAGPVVKYIPVENGGAAVNVTAAAQRSPLLTAAACAVPVLIVGLIITLIIVRRRKY